jgi:hypothetical protein
MQVVLTNDYDPAIWAGNFQFEAYNGKTWVNVMPYIYPTTPEWGDHSTYTIPLGISIPADFVAGQNFPLQKGGELKFRVRIYDYSTPANYGEYVYLDKTFKDGTKEETPQFWALELYDGSVDTDNSLATSGNKAVKVVYNTTTPLNNGYYSGEDDYISSAGTVVTGWDTNIFATAPTVELDAAGHLVVNLSVKFGQTASGQTIELKGVKDSSGNEVRNNVTILIP